MHNHNFKLYGLLFFISKDFNTTQLNELSKELFIRQKSAEPIDLHIFFMAEKKKP